MDIKDLIPHRDPFLWVSDILEHREGYIKTSAEFPDTLDFFNGHYPEHPIVPGVILCEACFQSGAAMISKQMQANGNSFKGVPVLTRILGAKFKKEVLPNDKVEIEVNHTETLSSAWFMKAKMRINSKLALSVEFAVMLT